MNRWLAVTRDLAREIQPEDYIDFSSPRSRQDDRGATRRLFVVTAILAAICGSLAALMIPMMFGYRPMGSAERRLVEAVYRVDPHPERWTDAKLTKRLEFRREAMDLIEHTLATTSASTYPYMSSLSGHPSPIIDPGTAPALLLLANALDQTPPGRRGHYVQAIVAVALALDEPDLQAALDTLSNLPKEVRRRLVANRAAGLMHLFEGELSFEDVTAERDQLQTRLFAETSALHAQVQALGSAIGATQRRLRELAAADRRCTAIFSQYRACLVRASKEVAGPDGEPASP